MKSYLWLTDTHLNFLTKPKLINFISQLAEKNSDGIFLTGDISTGPMLEEHLILLGQSLEIPVYFVNGNHDSYRSSFVDTQTAVHRAIYQSPNLTYLSWSEPITLTSNVALIGHDGWCDSGWRIAKTPLIFLPDWFFIRDFRSLFNLSEYLERIQSLAMEASEHIEEMLLKALRDHNEVIMLTHFPPWPEKYERYRGLFGLLDKFWMPYNSSKIMADTLIRIMSRYPNHKLLVLAGHVHNRRVETIAPNIELRVGGASLGRSEIQEIISI